MNNRETAWLQLAAAALARVTKPEHIPIAAMLADKMLEQWSARFGDGAFLLEGQTQCAACKTPIEPGDEFTPSVDGVKFCDLECLKASGREE